MISTIVYQHVRLAESVAFFNSLFGRFSRDVNGL